MVSTTRRMSCTSPGSSKRCRKDAMRGLYSHMALDAREKRHGGAREQSGNVPSQCAILPNRQGLQRPYVKNVSTTGSPGATLRTITSPPSNGSSIIRAYHSPRLMFVRKTKNWRKILGRTSHQVE